MLPTKIINIRLSSEQAEQFQRLKAEFRGLPQATVLRLLISAFLEMPMDRQIEVVTSQIRKPGQEPKSENNRMGSANNRSGRL